VARKLCRHHQSLAFEQTATAINHKQGLSALLALFNLRKCGPALGGIASAQIPKI
jgi:hypothetical protein